MEPDTGNWQAAANDVIGEAVLELQKKNYAGLVIIVDNLDHMDVRPHATAECQTDEYLFVNRATQLTGFACHVVYAMPISLAYSHHAQTIASHYGGEVPVVPMIRISTPPPKSRPHPKGMKKLRDVIKCRIDAGDAKEEDVFDSPKVRDKLIKLSGGDPSGLMRLVRETIISDDLPITAKSLQRVTNDGRKLFDRQLRLDHWPILDEVRQTGRYIRKKDNEEAFRELLDSRAILQYVNDTEWYGLNPMVALLKPPPSEET